MIHTRIIHQNSSRCYIKILSHSSLIDYLRYMERVDIVKSHGGGKREKGGGGRSLLIL